MEKHGFEILPHAADMRLRVWGKQLEDLFRAALRGMASYLWPEALKVKKKDLTERQKIVIEAVDIHSLLVEFLSKVVAHSDTTSSVFPTMLLKRFGENFLEGELFGTKADGFEKDIKAVSYHEVDIKKNPETGFYETILVFDV